MITDFPSNPRANMAGMQSFQFAPYHTLFSLPAIADNIMAIAPSFYSNGRFLNGYSTVSQLVFNETGTNDENGTVYDWLIQGFTPGDSPQLLSLMRRMHQCKHIVKTLDHMGAARLVGHSAPLTFNFIGSTGMVEGEDMRGYAFTFTGKSIEPAPHYIVV